MSNSWLMWLGIMVDPRVMRVPVRVLRELRHRGIERLPPLAQAELDRGVPRQQVWRLARSWLDGELISRHHGQWVVNSFLPPFPGRAYERMFENLLSGRHLSPISAYLAVTAECPYDCWHCSLKQRRTGNLSLAAWRSILQQLHDLGTSIVGFTGGEPLVRPDLPELVQAASSLDMTTIVFTSGSALNPSRAKMLKKAGLWALCVSLDHSDPVQCDRLRGIDGAYARAVEAIRLARQTGFYTMISTVATRAVIENKQYTALYQIASQLGAHEYRLIEPMPCGKLTDANKDAFLTTAHVAELRRFHVETNRLGKLPKVCAFNQIESPEIFGCVAGTQHLFVDSAGEVCPCDFTPLSFGNATREPLSIIWRRMNLAMGDNPRCHCFIQRHHQLIPSHPATGFPLPSELSEKICQQAGTEPLPGYFAMVVGNNKPRRT